MLAAARVRISCNKTPRHDGLDGFYQRQRQSACLAAKHHARNGFNECSRDRDRERESRERERERKKRERKEREKREREKRERDSASNHTDEPVVELITEVQLHASAPQCGAFGRREYAL